MGLHNSQRPLRETVSFREENTEAQKAQGTVRIFSKGTFTKQVGHLRPILESYSQRRYAGDAEGGGGTLGQIGAEIHK